MASYPWRIHGNGIFTYMNGWFLLGKLVGKYTSPMDPMGNYSWVVDFSPTPSEKYDIVKLGIMKPPIFGMKIKKTELPPPR